MSDQKPLSELVKVFWISLGIILSGAIIVLFFIDDFRLISYLLSKIVYYLLLNNIIQFFPEKYQKIHQFYL